MNEENIILILQLFVSIVGFSALTMHVVTNSNCCNRAPQNLN